MSDENDARAAYLAGLRQPALPQAAGAAPAPAPTVRFADAISPKRNEPEPSEKRRSPRYRCQGSAHLRETASGAATWASFTDISLHGCYVEAVATFRVGTALGLTIEANGYRIETSAEVRVAYPNLGMGIAFTPVSNEDRERLRELLRSLSRPSVILGPRPPSPSPVPEAASAPPAANPAAALQAITDFFEDRLILGREEFLRIMRKSQGR